MFEEHLYEYLIHLVAKGCAQETIRWRKSPLKLFFDYLAGREILDLKEVSRTHIDDYRLHLREAHRTGKGERICEGTYKDHLVALKGFFAWLQGAGRLLVNPFVDQEAGATRKPQKIPEILNAQEMMDLLESCRINTAAGLRDRAILEVLYSTGMRLSELVGLNVIDFSFDDREFVIVDGKGKKGRVVPAGEYACYFTESYLRMVRVWQVSSETEKALFVSQESGRRLARRTLFEIVKRIVKKSGIAKRITPHTFRHCMATHMLRNKADLRHIQAILGHASLAATEIYTHMTIEDLKEVVKRAHPHGRRRKLNSISMD